jgi:hypothetical protein
MKIYNKVYPCVGKKLFFFLCMKMVLCWTLESAFAQVSEIYAGATQVDITPKEAGYPHYRGPSEGVHDPLYAKALVFREGDQQIALVVCDLLWIERELSSKVRLSVAEKTDIPYSNILISGTHTHTGPAYHANIRELTGALRPPFDRQRDLGEDGYASWLVGRITKAITDASNAAIKVNLETGTGSAEGISFNRRFFMHDGKVRTNAGVGNPEIIRSVGPIDSEVGIILLRRASDNSPLASLTNFAVHADTFGGTAFSADYPGFLAKVLTEEFGNDFISVFGAGTCGDLNHVDVQSKKRLSSEDIGLKLAEVVKEKISHLVRIDRPFVGVLTEYVYAPPQKYTPEELDWANKEEGNPLYEESEILERRRRLKIRSLERIRRTEAVPPTVGTEEWKLPLEVQVFRIGEDVAIVGLPGEVFVELGLAIKKASPFKTTLIIELTNSHIAYVPTLKAFSQGGYETVNSRLAPGGGELMVASAIRMLNELNQ